MLKSIIKKNYGFDGQKELTIPKRILARTCTSNGIINDMCVGSIGYFPKARFHRQRANATHEHILLYCTEGQGVVEIDKRLCKIGPNDFLIIPRGALHVYETVENDPWTIYWVHFSGESADSIVDDTRVKIGGYKQSIHFSKRRIEMFESIYAQIERGYNIENLEYACLCFYHFLGSFIYHDKFEINYANQDQDLVNRVIAYIIGNIQIPLSKKKIASDLNISSAHLSFLFKKKTGYPLMEYVNNHKLRKACQYLMLTTMRIYEISSEIGINDPFYFSRFFKQQMGVSPRAYRNKIKKSKELQMDNMPRHRTDVDLNMPSIH